MIWTVAFWQGAGERAIKTFAQALVGAFGANAVGIMDVDWQGALSLAALVTLASILTSIGNADFVTGKAPEVRDPEVIAEIADDEAAKARFQLSFLGVGDEMAGVDPEAVEAAARRAAAASGSSSTT